MYVVSPLDVVPDFLIGMGLLDDAAIVAWAFARLRAEVERYHRSVNSDSGRDALLFDPDE